MAQEHIEQTRQGEKSIAPASVGGNAAASLHQDRTLYLLSQLQTSLEVTTVVRLFAEECAKHVAYDSYRFSQSDAEIGTVSGVSYLFWQPESHQDVFGLRIGLYFP